MNIGSLEMLKNVGAPLLLNYKYKLNEVLAGIFYEIFWVKKGFFQIWTVMMRYIK